MLVVVWRGGQLAGEKRREKGKTADDAVKSGKRPNTAGGLRRRRAYDGPGGGVTIRDGDWLALEFAAQSRGSHWPADSPSFSTGNHLVTPGDSSQRRYLALQDGAAAVGCRGFSAPPSSALGYFPLLLFDVRPRVPLRTANQPQCPYDSFRVHHESYPY